MDLYVKRYKNKGTVNETCEELFYARKFWELLDAKFVDRADLNSYIETPIMKEEELEELIDIAVHNRNYFGTYDSIPQLCEIRDGFQTGRAEGYSYVLEANW